MSLKEISLMMRSGFSDRFILNDLSARGLRAAFSQNDVAKLKETGGSATLIDELRGTGYVIPDDSSATVAEGAGSGPPQPGAASALQREYRQWKAVHDREMARALARPGNDRTPLPPGEQNPSMKK